MIKRTPYIVKIDNDEEGRHFVDYLVCKDFDNVQNLSGENLHNKVLIITDKKFYTTNITCLAIACKNIAPISVKEFVTKMTQSKTNIR